MDLSPAELDELARFFARRLTTALEPIDPAAPPSADHVDAWREHLSAAARSGSLPALARRIARIPSADDALREACGLLQVGAPSPVRPLVVGAIAVVAALALVAAVAGARVVASDAIVAPVTEPTLATALPDPEPLALPEDVGPVEIPSATPEDAVAAAQEADRAHPADALPAADAVDRCPQVADGLVGYWYAGERSPGRRGDTVVIERAMNVRAGYPSEANGWRLDRTIRCVLEAGDTVRLSRDPVHVPRDDWWVPLYVGDVIAAAPATERVARASAGRR